MKSPKTTKTFPQKSNNSGPVFAHLVNAINWRQYGALVWSIFVSIPILLVSGITWWTVFMLLIRCMIFNSSLRQHIGIRYRSRVFIVIIDAIIFGLAICYSDLVGSQLDSANSYTVEDEIAKLAAQQRLLGKIGWVALAVLIYHSITRSEYFLIFPPIMQRRLFRMRQSIPSSLRIALKTLMWIPYFLLWLSLISFVVVTPLNRILLSFTSSSITPTSSQQPIGVERELLKTGKASRGGWVPTEVVLVISRALLQFMDNVTSNMNIYSIPYVCSRLWEIAWAVVALESIWNILAIIHTERFSFDPLGKHGLNPSEADFLLKSKKPSRNSATTERNEPLIFALRDSNPYISAHALQDLYDLAVFHKDRRSEIWSDYHGTLWNDLASACLHHVDKMTNQIMSAIEHLNKSKESENKFHSKSKSTESLISITKLKEMRKQLDSKIRHIFRFIRPQSLDMSPEEALKQKRISSPLLLQSQLSLILAMKCLSRLMAVSATEDNSGIIAASNLIPSIVKKLLDLHISLSKYGDLLGMDAAERLFKEPPANSYFIATEHASHVGVSPATSLSQSFIEFVRTILGMNPVPGNSPSMFDGFFLANSFTTATLTAVSESLYEITTTYYEHLLQFEFIQPHIAVLENFVNFTH